MEMSVTNFGSKTAYDVEAVVRIVYPEDFSHFLVQGTIAVGSVSLDSDGRTLRWKIPEVGPLRRVAIGPEGALRVVVRVTTGEAQFDYFNEPHEFFGEVTTSSFESDSRMSNNTSRAWSYGNRGHTSNRSWPAEANYSITSASVDERLPSPGDLINFTFTAHFGGFHNIDSEAAIVLTDGLAVDEDPSATPPPPPCD